MIQQMYSLMIQINNFRGEVHDILAETAIHTQTTIHRKNMYQHYDRSILTGGNGRQRRNMQDEQCNETKGMLEPVLPF